MTTMLEERTRADMNYLAVILGLLVSLHAGHVGADEPAMPERVLFVGNSYTAGIKAQLADMLRQQRINAHVELIHPGGKTLAWHLTGGTAEKIRRGKYDVVVLQEQSQVPAYPGLQEKFWKSSAELTKVIRASGGRPALYMTWGRRDGDKQNARLAPTYEKMQHMLTASYRKAAAASGAELVPVGEVWGTIRKADAALARRFYRGDGSHPSQLGAFVTAMTFTCQLFHRKPQDVAAPAGLRISAGELNTIREAVAMHLEIKRSN